MPEPIPVFLLQIVRNIPPYDVVHRLRAGGPLERDLVAACATAITGLIVEDITARAVEAIIARGVGLFRTEQHVTAAIRTALPDAIAHGLQVQVEAGITKAILDLKTETRLVMI